MIRLKKFWGIFVVLCLLGIGKAYCSGEGDVLFLCHFNGNLEDESGAIPVDVKGEMAYEEGRAGTKALKMSRGVRISYNRQGNFNPDEGTVSYWIKPLGWSGSNLINITKKAATSIFIVYTRGTKNLYHLYFNSYSTGFGIYDKDGKYHASIVPVRKVYFDGEWTHLAATWKISTGEVRFYVNGRLAKEITGTVPFEIDSKKIKNFIIQGYKRADVDIPFLIDKFKISKRAEFEDEIAKEYKKGK